ncbi:MAG: DUF4175 family protein [Blastocatellia bacterium]
MEIRSILKKIEARATLRDFLKALLWVFASAGLFFILFGVLDYCFSFSFKTRLAIAASVILLVIVGLVFDLIRKLKDRGAIWAAQLIEQRAATLGNQLFTLAESDSGQTFLPAYLRTRMENDLSRKLESLTPARVIKLYPGRAVMFLVVATLVVYVLVFSLFPRVAHAEFSRLILFDRSEAIAPNAEPHASEPVAAQTRDGIEELRVVLYWPAYTRRSPTVQTGEGNIVALNGTRADVIIKTDREVAVALLSTGGDPAVSMEREGEMSYRASFVVSNDSNYKVSLTGLAESGWKWEGVYSIRAVKDNPPEVHITRPASDLLFTATNRPASLSIEIAAKDDYDIAQLKLKYIKTTGEGDQSRFESGDVNVNRAAANMQESRGSVQLDLAALNVAPGTSIVFHAEAVDRNSITGPGVGYSESLIVSVAGPEPVKISLDDMMPDEALKYLTSERMILIKTEKLHRQRGKLSTSDFDSRSQDIAFEQRRFRASFNQFTELEPEHEHAEASDPESQSEPAQEGAKLRDGSVPDVPAGAGEQLREMILAIRAMWNAEGALATADTATAMEFEKEAITHLKAAQKGARYFSRVVARPKPVDLKRRYMGVLDQIHSRLERVARKPESAFDKQLRNALASVYDAARLLAQPQGGGQRHDAARQKVDRAAEELLSIRGEGAGLIFESASKLKLLARMLDGHASTEEQDVFALLVQVASEMSAALGRDEITGTASPSQSLPPAARSKAARYFKLLANPFYNN